MGLFTRKKNVPALPAPHQEDDDAIDTARRDLAELNGLLPVAAKSLSASSYVAFDQADDQGGYFGPEFDVRSNAGRIKSLYSREPWIYATASRIAWVISSIPLKVYPKGGEQDLPSHPVKALLDAGTPVVSNAEAKFSTAIDLTLGGNSWLVLEKDYRTVAGVAPVELVELRYDQSRTRVIGIDLKSPDTGLPSGFFPFEQLVQCRYPNPFHPFYGFSPIAAAARPILLDRYKGEFEMAFYLRGATNTGVIETTEDISRSRFKRLLLSFEQTFTGRSNWWRTIFLPKGASWKASGLTMQEAQHLEGLRENRKTILAVLGVPPSIVGITEDVNRATSEQQESVFWNNTVIPLAGLIASGWNQSHLVKSVYRGEIEVRPDFTGIEAAEGFISAKAERAKAMEPYFLIDEIRSSVWKAEPLPDGRGDQFVSEVRGGAPAGSPLAGFLAAPQVRAAEIPQGMDVQTLIFAKEQFPRADDATKWATDHGYRADKVDETSESWRLRQNDPDAYDPDSLRTITLTQGVSAVVGTRVADDGKSAAFAHRKAVATSSQNRVESKLGGQLEATLAKHTDDLLAEAKCLILAKADVRKGLHANRDERRAAYLKAATPTLTAAMNRGFSLALSQVKAMPPVGTKAKVAGRFTGVTETDRQAADVLRERTEDGRRKVLTRLAAERFYGFDDVQSDRIVDLIERGTREGDTFEQIAAKLRDAYDETYGNQMRTIVRTEILSAVSEGLAWNHDVLGQVFSKTKKQWLHQGDGAINPDVREEHVSLEEMGEIDGDDEWTYSDPRTGEEVRLRYPRDPQAPAGAVINCRCSQVTVIPEDATSNAEAILEGDL